MEEGDGENKHFCLCFQCSDWLNSFEIKLVSVCVKWTVNHGQSETGLRTCVSDVAGHLSSLLVHGNFEKVFLCMVAACLVGSYNLGK